MLKTIFGIIFFAITTIILFLWGYIKEQRIYTDLTLKLNRKAEKLIINTLKRRKYMTKKEIGKLLSNLKVSQFGSRKKVIVNDTITFTKKCWMTWLLGEYSM